MTLLYRILGAAAVLGSFFTGYLVHPKTAAPVPNAEQRVRLDGALYTYVQVHPAQAFDYDFPNPLGCHKRIAGGGGIACWYGVTYMDECTRQYLVGLAADNSMVTVGHKRKVCPPTSPP